MQFWFFFIDFFVLQQFNTYSALQFPSIAQTVRRSINVAQVCTQVSGAGVSCVPFNKLPNTELIEKSAANRVPWNGVPLPSLWMYGDIPTRKPCGRVLKFVFAFPKYLHVILHRISSRSDSPPCASVCVCS